MTETTNRTENTMPTAPKLTDARRRALAVLAAHRAPLKSNETIEGGNGRIYWQTAEWLLEVGYAKPGAPPSLEITDAGRARAELEGLEMVA